MPSVDRLGSLNGWMDGTLGWKKITPDVQTRDFVEGVRSLILSMKAPNVMVKKCLVFLSQGVLVWRFYV